MMVRYCSHYSRSQPAITGKRSRKAAIAFAVAATYPADTAYPICGSRKSSKIGIE